MIVLTNTGFGIISKRLTSNSPLPNTITIGNGNTNGHVADPSDISLFNPVLSIYGTLSTENTIFSNDTSTISGNFDFSTDTVVNEIGIFAGTEMYISINTDESLAAGETLTVIVKVQHRG